MIRAQASPERSPARLTQRCNDRNRHSPDRKRYEHTLLDETHGVWSFPRTEEGYFMTYLDKSFSLQDKVAIVTGVPRLLIVVAFAELQRAVPRNVEGRPIVGAGSRDRRAVRRDGDHSSKNTGRQEVVGQRRDSTAWRVTSGTARRSEHSHSRVFSKRLPPDRGRPLCHARELGQRHGCPGVRRQSAFRLETCFPVRIRC